LVFICRITHEHYKSTPYKDELLHIKLDKMLPTWLSPIFETPLYTIGCQFEYDIKKKKKVERARKKAAGISDDDDYDSEEAESSEDEVPAKDE